MNFPILFLLASLTGGAAHASILLSGSFSSDDQMQLFTVSMSIWDATVESTGYAGGGFDTVLSLFTTHASQTLLALNDDGICAFCYDAGLSLPSRPATTCSS